MNKQENYHPDFNWFKLFCKQDKEASENIYKDFFPKIKKMVRMNKGSSDDAWDLFQEGLIVLMVYCNKEVFQLKVPLFNFFYPICRRLWLKELEKKGKSWITFSELPEYKNVEYLAELQEEEVLHAQRLQMLFKHLENLPPKEKETLKLYYLEKKSHREIAKIMGFSNESSAKVQKFKYIRNLRASVFGDRDFE